MFGEDVVPQAEEILTQAQQVALYYTTLKGQGIGDYDALELTKEWMGRCFEDEA